MWACSVATYYTKLLGFLQLPGTEFGRTHAELTEEKVISPLWYFRVDVPHSPVMLCFDWGCHISLNMFRRTCSDLACQVEMCSQDAGGWGKPPEVACSLKWPWCHSVETEPLQGSPYVSFSSFTALWHNLKSAERLSQAGLSIWELHPRWERSWE